MALDDAGGGVMSFELRPSNNVAFQERLRSAEARRLEELNNTSRRPRIANMAAAKRRWDLEEQQEMRRIARQHREICE